MEYCVIKAGSLGIILSPSTSERERLVLVRFAYQVRRRRRTLIYDVPLTMLRNLGVDAHVGLRIDPNPHMCNKVSKLLQDACLAKEEVQEGSLSGLIAL